MIITVNVLLDNTYTIHQDAYWLKVIAPFLFFVSAATFPFSFVFSSSGSLVRFVGFPNEFVLFYHLGGLEHDGFCSTFEWILNGHSLLSPGHLCLWVSTFLKKLARSCKNCPQSEIGTVFVYDFFWFRGWVVRCFFQWMVYLFECNRWSTICHLIDWLV